ncbi:MAG: AbrB family transcriptional regulator [Treponemataceae bacterium]|nr:MAG: AbrB family transcriptional regulator [Treponemataceae bacterium]
MNAAYFLFTLAAAGVLGFIFEKLKIPSGLRIGALLATAVLNIGFASAWVPGYTKLVVQSVAGALIGCGMEKSDISRLPKVIKPTLIMLASLFILNIGGGILIHAVSPLDWVTSFMSVIPGGVTDTPVIAADMGADMPIVAVLQLSRLLLGISIFPPMILWFDNWRNKQSPAGIAPCAEDRGGPKRAVSRPARGILAFICTMMAAIGAGYAGSLSHIPAGSFLFAIAAVSIIKLVFDFAFIPSWAKKATRVLAGCYIGVDITMSTVHQLKFLILPLIIILGGFTINCFITGKILSVTCGFTRKEGMLITTPAGATDIALNSTEIGVQNTDVIVIQVFRSIIAIAVFPQIINAILKIAGR